MWVVGSWCGYLSGAWCWLAYNPADATATATHCLLLQWNPGWFTFLVLAHPGSPRKRAVKRVCVCVCVVRPRWSQPPIFLLRFQHRNVLPVAMLLHFPNETGVSQLLCRFSSYSCSKRQPLAYFLYTSNMSAVTQPTVWKYWMELKALIIREKSPTDLNIY